MASKIVNLTSSFYKRGFNDTIFTALLLILSLLGRASLTQALNVSRLSPTLVEWMFYYYSTFHAPPKPRFLLGFELDYDT